jgi:hypothetical protein
MLQNNGPISLSDLQNEFAGTDPIGLAEYYRGGDFVDIGTAAGTGSFQTDPLIPSITVQIPNTGAIQLSQFYGTHDTLIGNTGVITAPVESEAISDYVDVILPASVNYIRLFLVGGGGGGGGPNAIGGGDGGGGSVLHGTISTAWAGDLWADRILRFYIGRGGSNGYTAPGVTGTYPLAKGGSGYGMYGLTYSGAWSTFMNTHAVTTNMTGGIYAVNEQRTSRMIHFPETNGYVFNFLADNAVSIEVDGTVIADTYGSNDQGQNTQGSFSFTNPLTRTQWITAGWHKVTFIYTNTDSVGSFAVQILLNGIQLWSTRDEYNTWVSHPVGGQGGSAGFEGASGFGGAGGAGTMVTLVTSSGEYFLGLAGGGGGGGGGGDRGLVNVSLNGNWCNQGWTTAYYPARVAGCDGECLWALNNDGARRFQNDGGGGGGGGGGITNTRQYIMDSNKAWAYSGFGGRTLRGNLIYNDTCADGGESGKSCITAYGTRCADLLHIPTTSRYPIWPSSVVNLYGTTLAALSNFGHGGNGSSSTVNAGTGGSGAAYIDWGSTDVAVLTPPIAYAPVKASIINYSVSAMPSNGGAIVSPLYYYFQVGQGQNEFYLDAFGGGGNPGTEYTYSWTIAEGIANLYPSGGRCLVQASDSIGTGHIQCTVADGNSYSTADYYWQGVYPDEAPVQSTCFPANSMVMMADKTFKPIQKISVGEMVMGPNGGTKVLSVEKPYLGTRKLLSLSDGHTWSEEHSHWICSDDDHSQWWWSANPESWHDEVNQGLFGGLLDNTSLRTGMTGFKFAHIDGWKREVPKEIQGEYSMVLYFIKTDGTPIIVNGYLVGAGANEQAFDYTKLNWDDARVFIKELKTYGTAVPGGISSREPPVFPLAERPDFVDENFVPAPVLTDNHLSPNHT